MVIVKAKETNKLQFLTSLFTNLKFILLLSASVIVFLHILLFYLHHDPTPSGRALYWLQRNGIRPLTTTPTKAGERGGVVVFLHMPHTGGTTVKMNLNKRDHGIMFQQTTTVSGLQQQSDQIINILKRNITEDHVFYRVPTLFLVLHDYKGTMLQIRNMIEMWRKVANQHRTTFFAFTLIRDPLDYHFSVLDNEYLRLPSTARGSKGLLCHDFTSNDCLQKLILDTMKPNEQCQKLVHGNRHHVVDAAAAAASAPVTWAECQELYNWMTRNLDWIGTTDGLSTQTLPLLAQFMLGDADRAESFTNYKSNQDLQKNNNNNNNNPDRRVKKAYSDSFDSNTILQVRQRSELDQKLYDWVKTKYSI